LPRFREQGEDPGNERPPMDEAKMEKAMACWPVKLIRSKKMTPPGSQSDEETLRNHGYELRIGHGRGSETNGTGKIRSRSKPKWAICWKGKNP